MLRELCQDGCGIVPMISACMHSLQSCMHLTNKVLSLEISTISIISGYPHDISFTACPLPAVTCIEVEMACEVFQHRLPEFIIKLFLMHRKAALEALQRGEAMTKSGHHKRKKKNPVRHQLLSPLRRSTLCCLQSLPAPKLTSHSAISGGGFGGGGF